MFEALCKAVNIITDKPSILRREIISIITNSCPTADLKDCRSSVYNSLRMPNPTRRQREVLDFLKRYIATHGYVPSYQVIARHLGVSSKAGVAKHIRALEDQGFVLRNRENGRFQLNVAMDDPVSESGPLVDWIRQPQNDGNDGWDPPSFVLPPFVLGSFAAERISAFRVPDSGMIEQNICEGDIALIERRTFVRDGSIAAVVVKHRSALLRIYYRAGSKVELSSSNALIDTVSLPADKVEVIGIFRGLIRPIG